MTRFIARLEEIAAGYDAIVFDQWGVLHDGSRPYPGAVAAVAALSRAGQPVAVLSNSGKRAAPNADRIRDIGFQEIRFDQVMTSGEALWRDIRSGRIPATRFFSIERAPGDALNWAEGLARFSLSPESAEAEAILLMGLPDGSSLKTWQPLLDDALARGLTVYCSNPDRASPRAGGRRVLSPGALAHAHEAAGGTVVYYGKPHAPVFKAVEDALGVQKILMVGDSLAHDIRGADAVGWDSLLVQNGLYAHRFAAGDRRAVLNALCAEHRAPAPTFSIPELT